MSLLGYLNDNIAALSMWATALSLPVGAGALAFAAHQSRRSGQASAGAVVLAASEAFSNRWGAFRAATNAGEQEATFGELLNIIEACCAVYRDGLLVGRSGALLDTYLVNTLTQIEQSDGGRTMFARLVETDRTFEEIGWFLRKKRRQRLNFLVRLRAYEER